MTTSEQKLWEKIRSFELDNSNSGLTFSERLARENSWTLEYSLRVILEYKRFIFLLCTSNYPLTPSDAVDQVWHLHLVYTKSYWTDFCSKTLEREIHHNPTNGGETEKMKFYDWYEKTKDLYYEVFNKIPPKDIWPSSSLRFKNINFIRVNTGKFWIVPKPKFLTKNG